MMGVLVVRFLKMNLKMERKGGHVLVVLVGEN